MDSVRVCCLDFDSFLKRSFHSFCSSVLVFGQLGQQFKLGCVLSTIFQFVLCNLLRNVLCLTFDLLYEFFSFRYPLALVFQVHFFYTQFLFGFFLFFKSFSLNPASCVLIKEREDVAQQFFQIFC